MFLYVILFNCKMPMKVLFQIKFHRHSPYNLIVFIVFHQFLGLFLVFRVNVS